MGDVIGFPGNKDDIDGIKPMDLTDMVSVMLYAFGVDVRFEEVAKYDATEEAIYCAQIDMSKDVNGLICNDCRDAVEIWTHCYEGMFFESKTSVITSFISCVLGEKV